MQEAFYDPYSRLLVADDLLVAVVTVMGSKEEKEVS